MRKSTFGPARSPSADLDLLRRMLANLAPVHPPGADIFLSYCGLPRLTLNGLLVTARDEIDQLIAYCPLPPGLAPHSPGFIPQLLRQLKIAVRIATWPESAVEAPDAIDLGRKVGRPTVIPHWVYALSCVPLARPWDGRFLHPRPFCPELFLAMAEQPEAAAWLLEQHTSL